MTQFKKKLKNPYTWINIGIMAILTSLSYLHELPSEITSWRTLWMSFCEIVCNPYALFMVLWACWMEFHQLPPDSGIQDTEKLLDHTAEAEEKEADNG